MRHLRTVLLAPLLLSLFVSTANAQKSEATPLVRFGSQVRYLAIGDTTWVKGRVIWVGSCLAPLANAELSSFAGQGGYAGIFFSSISAVEAQQDSAWVRVPEAELAVLRACSPN